MIPLSILDLAPITEGSSAGESFRRSLDLAQHAEKWGFRRFWLAEHHGMPGIASAATSVLLAHVAAGTKSIRVGAGGVMLPNHSPLVIAEQFGTLEALHPGRIDLGLGRAPGSDPITSRALRRNLQTSSEEFPQDVIELQDYFAGATTKVKAVPGAGAKVPIWILGSSLFGAQLAAALGLPFAFASHFAPGMMMQAIEIYRARFKPSAELEKPYVMLGFNVFAADSHEEAELLATSVQQAFVNLRTGNPTQLKAPVKGYREGLRPQDAAILESALACTAVGTAEEIRADIEEFVDFTKADELMVTSQVFDHAARIRSYEILAGVMNEAATIKNAS
ncbi:MAG TPA: LLM class flavin-dependent oxidoreductase [Polyangiaceae bacterium]